MTRKYKLEQFAFSVEDVNNKKEIPKTLLIVYNGCQRVFWDVETIFDSKKFDSFKAVSYVSSPKFFSRVVKNFKTVRFVLGIDSPEYAQGFASAYLQLLDINKRIDFFNELDKEVKEKVAENSVIVRYCNTHLPVHSKIYILENSQTGTRRIIIGSANLTEKAFSGENQYENIAIFDDPDDVLFQIYSAWFDELFTNALDYIPQEVKEKFKKEKQTEFVLVDDEDKASILAKELTKNVIKLVPLTQEVYDELKGLPQTLVVSAKLKAKDIENKVKVIQAVTEKADSNTYRIVPMVDLKQKVKLAVITEQPKNENEQQLDLRQNIVFWDKTSLLYVKAENSDEYTEFSARVPEKVIKRQIQLLTAFIESYSEYATNVDTEYMGKIMEAILFAFVSPYLWKIREDMVIKYGSDNFRVDVPIFLVIGGSAYSGKTTLLETIGMLLGNRPGYFMPYSKVVSDNNKVKPTVLKSYFDSGNVMPLLFDEVHPTFFKGELGTRLIKELSNDSAGKHPAMICTTNADNFFVNYEVLRRVYFLVINKVFDIKHSLQAKKRLLEIRQELDTSLFKDFSYRFGTLIRNGEEYYREGDWLFGARKIFKNYYMESGLKIPTWFPEGLYDEYLQRGRLFWRQCYFNYKDAFKENNDGTLYVDFEKMATKNIDLQAAIKLLDPKCIKDSMNCTLFAKEFYDFIGVKKTNTLFSHLFKIVGIKRK